MIFGNINQVERYAFLPEELKAVFAYMQEQTAMRFS